MANERPVVFSAEQVRALKEGWKLQHRVLVEPQPELKDDFVYWKAPELYDNGDGVDYLHTSPDAAYRLMEEVCPFGQPGDRLWVQEPWGPSWHHAQPLAFYHASDDVGWHPDFDGWQPAADMPRWASRFMLEITRVWVERVQDTSEYDAWAEGIDREIADQTLIARDYSRPNAWFQDWHEDYPDFQENLGLASFRTYWDAHHKEHPWETNPWVWMLEFKVS